MARGNGKQAQQAQQAGKLSAFVKPKDGAQDAASNREYVDWGEINPQLIAGAVWAANKEGGALLFGHARDKSCYSIKVYAGGDGTAYYFTCSERGVVECEDFLRSIIELASQ